MKKDKYRQGSFTLGLVMLVNLVLMVVILTIQGLILLSIRLGKSGVSEKATFYSAEGTMFDSLARMSGSLEDGEFTWPTNIKDSGYFDKFLGPEGTGIERKISYDNSKNQYVIDVTASLPESTRRLVATMSDFNLGVVPADIMLAIDVSGSMQFGGNRTCSSWNTILPADFRFKDCSIYGNKKIGQPVFAAQSAAEYFVNLISTDPEITESEMQTGVITFETYAKLRKPLNNDHDLTITRLQGLEASGWTNVHHALQWADQQLTANKNPDPDARQAIILLSDGLPNRHNNLSQVDTKKSAFCNYGYTKGNEPRLSEDGSVDDRGYPCVDKVVNLAKTIKEKGVLVYAIGLGLKDEKYHHPDSVRVAKYLLNEIASEPSSIYVHFLDSWSDWDSPHELEQVYGQIFASIKASQILRINECPAGETCQ